MRKSAVCYTNDLHSHIIEGLPVLNALFLRKPDSLIVDTGDFSEGHPIYSFFKGKPERKVIFTVYDIVSPGNHGFQDLVELSREGFPVVNSHLYYKGDLLFRPTHVSKLGEYKVGFVGIISRDAFFSIERHFRNHIQFNDPDEALRRIVPTLKKQVDFVVLMSHSGFEHDRLLAEKYDLIDVILSGHCHSEHIQTIVNNTLITKAPELGAGFGELNFHYHNVSNDIHLGREFISECNGLSFLDPYMEKYRDISSRKLFSVSYEFSLSHASRKDLMIYLVEHIRAEFNADVCLINYHCLRGVFSQGNVTSDMLYRCIPFNTYLVGFDVEKVFFNEALLLMPNSIKNYLCISINDEKQSEIIHIITTDYLMLNYFDFLCIAEYLKILPLSEYVIDLFSRHKI